MLQYINLTKYLSGHKFSYIFICGKKYIFYTIYFLYHVILKRHISLCLVLNEKERGNNIYISVIC